MNPKPNELLYLDVNRNWLISKDWQGEKKHSITGRPVGKAQMLLKKPKWKKETFLSTKSLTLSVRRVQGVHRLLILMMQNSGRPLYTEMSKNQSILKSTLLRKLIYSQYPQVYWSHISGRDTALIKISLFALPEREYYLDPWGKISELLHVSRDQAKWASRSLNEFVDLIRKRFNSPL